MRRRSAWLTYAVLATLPSAHHLPLPPPLPSDPPTDLAAPMPNDGFRAPDVGAADGRSLAFHIYRMREFGTGEGYIPGSSYQSPEQRRPMQTPGFLVTVPLQ